MKMKIRLEDIELDVHTHTIASGHAFGTIREMAYAAKYEKNLQLLGFSEHDPGIPGACDPIYFRNLDVAPKCLYGLPILYGAEVNILDGKLSMDDKTLDLLDYAIAGFHLHCYQSKDKKTNTENMIEAMKHPKIHIISHPDDANIPLDYEKIVQVAKDHHVLIEINNNSLRNLDIRKNVIENDHLLLNLCKYYKVKILLSSDAHDPSDIKNYQEIQQYFYDIDFPDELIMNYTKDDFLSFIQKKIFATAS